MKTSEKFERQIRRIHELIEHSNTAVTWNERLPDPDNPEQDRQIDITIRRDGHLTLVECRIHRHKQDVKWIEELIGRRQSLRADAIIAVSASGFTQGAILKAKSFGVILRDFITLTEEEIRSWGCSTAVKLIYYQYNNVKLLFTPANRTFKSLTIDNVIEHFEADSNDLYKIFESVANKLDEQGFKGRICHFKGVIDLKGALVTGQPLANVIFEAAVKTVEQKLEIPSVVAYDAPSTYSLQRNAFAFVEMVDLGDFEITRSSDEVIVTMDLSPIQIPQNCQFRFVDFEFDRTVHITHCEIVGLPPMVIPLQDICIGVS